VNVAPCIQIHKVIAERSRIGHDLLTLNGAALNRDALDVYGRRFAADILIDNNEEVPVDRQGRADAGDPWAGGCGDPRPPPESM
jgi:hypothetical protein